MKSTKISLRNEETEYTINRYLPQLTEAPDYNRLEPLPNIMPKLTRAPSSNFFKRRRHSVCAYSRTPPQQHLPLDDSVTSRRRFRRTKKEIMDERFREFLLKQKEELDKIRKQRQNNRPRMKEVIHKYNTINNIAYATLSTHKRIFKCVSIWCRFKTMNISSFESHLEDKHSDDNRLISHSYCTTCDSNIKALTLVDEFNHMIKSHIEQEDTLENLIQLLDDAEFAKNAVKMESDDKEESKFNLGKFHSSAILNTPPYGDEEVKNSYNDDIERSMRMLFGESPEPPKSAEKIEILSVCALPRIDTSKVFTDVEEKPIQQRESVIVNNSTITIPKTETTKPRDTEECSDTLQTDEVIVTLNVIDLNSFNSCKAINSPETAEFTEVQTQTDTTEAMIQPTKVSTTLDDAPTKQIEENIAVPNTPEFVFSTPPLTPPIQRAMSVDQQPPNWERVYKRSISVTTARGSNQHSPEDSEPTLKQQKLARSDFISRLIEGEKSAKPKTVTQEASTPDDKITTKRRDSLINFEASTSKASNSKASNSNAFDSQQKLDRLKAIKLTELVFPSRPSDRLKIVNASTFMPWISARLQLQKLIEKYDICVQKMLTKNALIALFKCMKSKCSFTTNNTEIFLNHLANHQLDKEISEPKFHCSYCLLSEKDPKRLVHHINDVHSQDNYQCPHCFYRSREKESCYQHVLKHHRDLKTFVYSCPGRKPLESDLLMKRLKRKREENVTPIICKCELKFRFLRRLLRLRYFKYLLFSFQCYQ